MTSPKPAPPLIVEQWFNSEHPIELAALRGRVVLIYAFQMLCPGCVQHSVPQARDVFEAFDRSQLVVLGLHTVFEHHAAMPPHALEVFLHENRLRFPVGVDARGAEAIPRTMHAYAMQGTPTTVLIDRLGRRRGQRLGHVKDMQLAASLAMLMLESVDALSEADGCEGEPARR